MEGSWGKERRRKTIFSPLSSLGRKKKKGLYLTNDKKKHLFQKRRADHKREEKESNQLS